MASVICVHFSQLVNHCGTYISTLEENYMHLEDKSTCKTFVYTLQENSITS